MPIWKGKLNMAASLAQLYKLMLSNHSTIRRIKQIDNQIIIHGDDPEHTGVHTFVISPGGLHYTWQIYSSFNRPEDDNLVDLWYI